MADRRIRWKPYTVLLLSLSVTAAGSALMMRTAKSRDRMRFQNAIESAQDRIQTRLEAHVSLLIGGSALFIASDRVTLGDFRAYVRRLDVDQRYPGVQGIGFSERIRKRSLAAVEQSMRAEGQSDFRIWPSFERDEYHAIVYLEPLDRLNAAAIGYDMFTDEVRRRAMERARDTGNPAVSGPVTLIQEIEPAKQPGFLIYVPVYRGATTPSSVAERREALLGFVYSPFRAGDLFARIFGTEAHPRVGFSVYDGEDLEAPLIHRAMVPDHEPRFTARRTLWIADRPWTIDFHTTPFFDRTSPRSMTYLAPLIGALASLIAFLLTMSEARARAEAEAQRKNLHALLMEAPAAIAIVRGPDLRYELSNPLNQQLTRGRALVGRTVRESLPELEAQGVIALAEQVYRTGHPVAAKEFPIAVPEADGSTRQLFIDGVYQAMRGANGIEGVVVFAYDVTEQVLARKRIELLAEDLQKAVRARDDFLSIAGHELNTPLTALRIQLDALASLVREPQLNARFGKMQRQLSRLERLVSELLDVSRISAGRLAIEREEVDLNGLAHEVISRFEEQATKSGSQLVMHGDGSVVARCDRMRIDQVLTNLMSNALKYGGGKPIEISIGLAEEIARLEVRDHGIGISPADAERIFGRYERAVSQRNFGGLGLGLWIARQIVEAHGGRISLLSEPSSGSAFVVELPSARRGEDAAQGSEPGEIVDVGGQLREQEASG